MTKGMVGRVCGLGAVCCIALAAWTDRSEAGVQTPVRSNAVARPKTSAHKIGIAEKHQPTGKALTAKHVAAAKHTATTSKHAVKSSTLKHGVLKATHPQRANAVVSHAALDRHHGGAKHGASTKSAPGKSLGYPLTAHAKP
jgi:hypothetical protein